jgi:hypothetical protein
MLKRLSLASVIAFALTLHANAAEFHYVTDNQLLIAGKIVNFDGGNLRAIAASRLNRKPVTVILDSFGGQVKDAIEMGQVIHNNKWETSVPNGNKCESACTLLWLAGVNRHLGKYAQLGFHSSALIANGPCQPNTIGNAVIRGYMLEMGAPRILAELPTQISPCAMYHVGRDTFEQWGMLDKPMKPFENNARPMAQVVRELP